MIGITEVKKAYNNVKEFVKKTPLIKFNDEIYLKMENAHDQINAFKVRGAYNKIKSLGSVKEVITAAVGSHGFAVGVIGKHLGIKTTCYMPENAPVDKKEKMAKLVDKVVVSGDQFSKTELDAKKFAEENNIPFVHPYNDEDIIAGQGSIALEVLEDLSEVKNLYMPVGGGGMLSGNGIVMKDYDIASRVIGCQPQEMHAMAESYKQGKITVVEPKPTFAEPLSVNLNSTAVTFPYVQKYVDEFILVTDKEIGQVVKAIYDLTGEKVEGAGGIALAAALKDKKRKGLSVCVVSGGNISDARFEEIIRA